MGRDGELGGKAFKDSGREGEEGGGMARGSAREPEDAHHLVGGMLAGDRRDGGGMGVLRGVTLRAINSRESTHHPPTSQ